jgi:hypothetical protein
VKYALAFKPRARKDLKALGSENLQRVLEKIEALTAEIALENKYDAQFRVVFDAIRELMEDPPSPQKPRIGFHPQNVRRG